MSAGMEWYIALIIGGMLLLLSEMIIPGGILGIVGSIMLFIAIFVGFSVFGPTGGILSAIAIVGGSVVGFLLWMKLLPYTRIGKTLTLTKSGEKFKATEDYHELIGLKGIAQTDLRPAGFIILNEKRLDVISENDWIEDGSEVEIVRIEGNRIVVRQSEESNDS